MAVRWVRQRFQLKRGIQVERGRAPVRDRSCACAVSLHGYESSESCREAGELPAARAGDLLSFPLTYSSASSHERRLVEFSAGNHVASTYPGETVTVRWACPGFEVKRLAFRMKAMRERARTEGSSAPALGRASPHCATSANARRS